MIKVKVTLKHGVDSHQYINRLLRYKSSNKYIDFPPFVIFDEDEEMDTISCRIYVVGEEMKQETGIRSAFLVGLNSNQYEYLD